MGLLLKVAIVSSFLMMFAPSYSHAESCYKLGFRYGRCATRSMLGFQCKPENNIVLPERCRFKPETEVGLDDGINSVYKQGLNESLRVEIGEEI